MLELKDSYEELYASFKWDIPEFFNIGYAVCDKWAEQAPSRLASIHKAKDRSVYEFSCDSLRDLSNHTEQLFISFCLVCGERVGLFLLK